MNIVLTWSITAIIAVASLISPIIVTFLNNRHNYKMKKLEIDSKVKQEILSKFTSTITREFNNNFIHNDFQASLNMLYIYFDVNDELINNIVNKKHNNLNEFQKDVNKLMKSLSKQIKSK